jgi:hypothetical protein
MNYAPLTSPAFIGVPTGPTAPAGTNSIQLATTAYVDSLYSPGAYIDANSTSVTLSDGVAVNLTSLSLAAGDWIINGSVCYNTGTALNYNFMAGANTISATLPSIPYYTQISPAGAMSGGTWTLNIPERRFSFTVPTTVYLVVRAGFGTGATVTAQGHIAAEQMQKLVAGTGGGPSGPITLAGDVSGASGATTVIGLQGRPMANTLPSDTQVLAWSSGAWRPTAAGGGPGGATPGGTSAQVQYNTGSGFGGSAGATFSATQLTSLAMGIGAGADALGDIYFRNVSGNLQRLPAGPPNYLLQMQGGVPTWQSVATGAGTVNPGAAPQIAQYQGANMVGGVTMSGDATIAVGGAVTLRSIGTAGSYNNVTTDANGRVIVGSNVAYLTGNQNITLIGDNTGSGSSGNINTVTVGLQGRQVASTAPTANGDVLAWHVVNNRWQPFPAATGGGITSITFAAPLTGGTISTSGQTVGLTVPSANLLSGNGTNFTSVVVGTGLSLTAGTLTATASGGNVTAGTLTINALTVGTAGQAIGSLGAGTAGQVLHSNGASLPTWGAVDLSSQVVNNLSVANLAGGAGANTNTFWRGDGSWQTPTPSGGGVVASPQFQIPYYPTATPTASVQGHPAITTTTGGSLTINRSGAGAPVPPAGLGLVVQAVGATGEATTFLLDAVGAGNPSQLILRRANAAGGGTVINADPLGQITWRGFGASLYPTAATARIFARATANFSDTVQPSRLEFETTEVSPGTAMTSQMIVGGGFGVTIGTPAAQASPAVGDLNCVRLFVGGIAGVPDTVSPTITAVVGGQGTVPLTSQLNVVTTCPVGGAVTLQAATAGAHSIVRNSGANSLLVYPAASAFINAQTINTAISVLPNSTAYFEAMSATQWFTVP